MSSDSNNNIVISALLKYPVWEDKRFFWLTGSYGIIIAVLYLALPIAIESLIGSITYTATLQPVLIVSIILIFLLTLSGILTLLQKHLIEIYYRASFVRLTTDFFIKAIYANQKAFHQHNTSDLNGRYFEIFSIQKSSAVLILEGMLIALQILVSIILVSFYHPYLFILNIICICVIVLTWQLFFKKAIDRAIQKSRAKFKVFALLNDVFRMNRFFKSKKNKDFVISQSKNLLKDYVLKCQNYWRVALKQNIILVLLYLFMTMSLFTVGSFLVIKGQLSLGQLVAAEIIFTGILISISRLGYYFDLFYNLVASSEELTDVFSIPDESISDLSPETNTIKKGEVLLKFNKSTYQDDELQSYEFNFSFESGSLNRLFFKSNAVRDVFIDLMMNYVEPIHGAIQFNNVNISLYNQHDLRDDICVIENTDVFTCTVREFLLMGNDKFDYSYFQSVLDLVELDKVIRQLPQELDTLIIGSGYPFMKDQIILLKIARTLICKPKILVLTEAFDCLSMNARKKILQFIAEKGEMMLLHCANYLDDIYAYEKYLYINESGHFQASHFIEFQKIVVQMQQMHAAEK